MGRKRDGVREDKMDASYLGERKPHHGGVARGDAVDTLIWGKGSLTTGGWRVGTR
jgi:hypothetical protein